MAGSLEKPALHVEGKDDLHSIKHLLIQHGVDYDSKRAALPEIVAVGELKKLLDGIETAVITSTDRAIGFVLDADSPLVDRWSAVCGRLSRAGVPTPELPPAEGFVGYARGYQTPVGVWLMPDNQHDGKLETLLRTLIAEEDVLIGHAQSSTDAAKRLGAKFSNSDREKAVLHAWLAWQEEPGTPYGTAIRATYFGHDSPAALAFVAWFKGLYGIA